MDVEAVNSLWGWDDGVEIGRARKINEIVGVCVYEAAYIGRRR